MFAIDHAALRALDASARDALRDDTTTQLGALTAPRGADDGWSAVVELVGSAAEVMLVHFRPTLDALTEAQRWVTRAAISDFLEPSYSFLSVTEAGFYHLTAQLAKDAAARGGKPNDAVWKETLEKKLAAELASDHVRKRLYPMPPAEMPYVCFYPMDKKRDHGQNWYILPVEERSRLMQEHGLSGRKYAGRIFQVISGSIGLADWEWGVTLFARDPLDFKKIVGEMRFDEASSKYGEFGSFFVGKMIGVEEWAGRVV
jgi:chlorite dismutase